MIPSFDSFEYFASLFPVLLVLVPGCFGVAAYVVLRLYRDRSAARERRLFNALIVPNLDDARFDPAEVQSLPSPAGRYLRHAIAPGTTACHAASSSSERVWIVAPSDSAFLISASSAPRRAGRSPRKIGAASSIQAFS